ncbi:MAG: glucose-6-phosphate dehydrogenase [Chloroflexi bacterium]|nr:glucose-6-phosphate dehydrogenase [Chloroflexota bacterium]
MAMPETIDPSDGPITLVIFGASGDLTRRKLIPALASLHSKGRLPPNLNILGVARSDMGDAEFHTLLEEFLGGDGMSKPTPDQWAEFTSRIHYIHGDVTKAEDIAEVKRKLAEIEGDGRDGNRLYYLSLAPSLYQPAITGLGDAGMADDANCWRRLVVEKPFGTDLASARELNDIAHSVFREDQVFRIDHYLGKETVQNLLVFRFANAIFEPVWNRNYIDHVQITVSETLRIDERGEYYDQTGIMRDMFQNHLLQLLTLVAMEPPHAFEAEALRNEKVKVLSAIRRIHAEDVGRHAIPGQYRSYRDETGVSPDSETATYAALRLHVDNWRWQGVPFYLRSGKALRSKSTEIIIQFRNPPHMLFPLAEDEDIPANTLAIFVQPDEGFQLEFQTKTPEAGLQMRKAELEFHYHEAFSGQAIPDAYERLLLDALNGDASLFTRADEIEQAWGIVDPIIAGLDLPQAPRPYYYSEGSWGPVEADRFLGSDGRAWLQGGRAR